MSSRALAVGLEAAALICGVLTYLHRDAGVVEGVYLDADDLEAATKQSWFDPFDFGNPYLWLGMTVAFAVGGIAVFLQSRRGV